MYWYRFHILVNYFSFGCQEMEIWHLHGGLQHSVPDSDSHFNHLYSQGKHLHQVSVSAAMNLSINKAMNQFSMLHVAAA